MAGTTADVLLRIPEFDAPWRRAVMFYIGWRWPIHLGDKRRLVSAKEVLNARQRYHECTGKIRKGHSANDHQQANAVPDNGVAFVRLVANAAIMGERDPATLADLRQPCVIGCIRREVIRMPFNCQTVQPENLAEPFAEIAVREIDERQAARS